MNTRNIIRSEFDPRVRKAKRFILSILREIKDGSRDRFPTLRQMSAESGYARSTLASAVKALVSKGILVTKHGKGIFPADSNPDINKSLCERPLRFVRAAESLRQAIRHGDFRQTGSLPSAKELCTTYGLSFPTLKKAITVLVTEKLLVHERGHYFIPRRDAIAAKRKIVLVAYSRRDGSVNLTIPVRQEFYRYLTDECRLRNLTVDILGYNDIGESVNNPVFVLPDGQLSAAPVPDRSVAGYVVGTWSLYDPRRLINIIGSIGAPVAVWIDKPDLEIHSRSRIPRIRGFDIGYSADVGRVAGEFLLELGHRRVAFISAHRDPWVSSRLDGIRNAYALAGIPDSVIAYINESARSTYEISESARNGFAIDSYINLKLLRAHLPHLNDDAWLRFSRTFLAFTIEGKMAELLEPLFQKALKDLSITAWICANDSVANLALDYLTRQHLRIPQDLSVVGFDNTYTAVERNLSSYSSNISGMAHSMLRHILNPADPAFPPNKTICKIPGTIIPRNSTIAVKTS